MKIVYLLTLIVTVSAIHDELWHEWKKQYQKSYNNNRNEQSRRAIWESNVETILQHNLRYDLGLETYSMGLNQFSDLTWEEFQSQYLIELKPESMFDGLSEIPFESEVSKDLPENIDWREKGMVTRVKNQGRCGSCWSFSATGALEAQYKNVSGELVSLSEQQLVDCTRYIGNHGCHGGLMGLSFRYLMSHGLERETDYPYHAREQACQYNSTKAIVKVTNFYKIPWGNEAVLKTMVGTRGPVAVAINVAKPFYWYRSGVFKIDTCRHSPLNHAVLITGYGVDNGIEYWTVKNSWGPGWGDHGYIRMARDYKNMCGIANLASIPKVEVFTA